MSVKEIVEEKIYARAKAKPEVSESIKAPVVFDISGDEGGQWTLDLSTPDCTVSSGAIEDPKVTLMMDAGDFTAMINGELNAQQAFLTGKLKVKGDMGVALKLGKLLA